MKRKRGYSIDVAAYEAELKRWLAAAGCDPKMRDEFWIDPKWDRLENWMRKTLNEAAKKGVK